MRAAAALERGCRCIRGIANISIDKRSLRLSTRTTVLRICRQIILSIYVEGTFISKACEENEWIRVVIPTLYYFILLEKEIDFYVRLTASKELWTKPGRGPHRFIGLCLCAFPRIAQGHVHTSVAGYWIIPAYTHSASNVAGQPSSTHTHTGSKVSKGF